MADEARTPDFMSVKELFERLGLSEHKVQELQRQNELPFPTVRIGGRVMFSRRAYDDWYRQFDYKGDASDETEDSNVPPD